MLDDLWSKSERSHDELLGFLHKFAGSAGMYQYDQISQQCIKLQKMINDSNGLETCEKEYRLLIQLIEQTINADAGRY